MSASIVEEKCLNNIVNFLTYEQFLKEKTNGKCTDLLKKLGYNLDKKVHCHRLLQDMLNLNIQAVEIRHPYDKVIHTGDYSFKRSAEPSLFKALKSINYWLCQCMGEPTASSILFRIFSILVRQMPEYKEAVFGKPDSLLLDSSTR